MTDQDLFAPEVVRDPYSYYGNLRETEPVCWNSRHSLWLLTRHDDLVWMLKNPDIFSSAYIANDTRPPYPEIYHDHFLYFERVRNFFGQMLAQNDQPEHQVVRHLLHRSFTPQAIESWRPLVAQTVESLIDQISPGQDIDLLSEFALPLPLRVIADLLGITAPDYELIREVSEKFNQFNHPEPDRMLRIDAGISELNNLLEPLIRKRQGKPRGDLLSDLAVGVESGVINMAAAVANAALILVAGHETTINLICNGVLAFARHPEQWDRLRNGSGDIGRLATEECLRYDGPVKTTSRLLVRDVVCRERELRAGERVRWATASANRDPRRFQSPELFDISRDPNPHLSFGLGVHHCLGANIARLEGQEAFMGLARRFASVDLVDNELRYQPSLNARSLRELWVTLN